MERQFSICKKCETPYDDEYIYWVKGRGWICEDCQMAEESSLVERTMPTVTLDQMSVLRPVYC